MIVPFGLSDGLRLEKAGLHLGWDLSIEELSRIGDPVINRHESAVSLRWENETVFSGLPISVTATSTAGPNAFYLDGADGSDSAQAEYGRMIHELTSRLGIPTESTIDAGYPWAKWMWDEVVVSLRIGERFTEYVSLMVAKGIIHA
jgi:hypothetical protein